MKKRNVLVVCGTRPEVIKLAPLVDRMLKSGVINPVVCNTGQHRDLSRQAFDYFDIAPQIDLDVMSENQTLFGLQSRLMEGLDRVYGHHDVSSVVVQGDTISAFCGALSGFYKTKPVFHVEAGLRSHNLAEPFPEEGLRQMLTRIARLHFAPTDSNRRALLSEGVADERIYVTGNTVVDALSLLPSKTLDAAGRDLSGMGIPESDRIVLITIHRRENHGERLAKICDAIKILSVKFSQFTFVLPVHPNPNVKEYIFQAFAGFENIKLTRAMHYPELVSLMRRSDLIISDSGGVQEEAPTFGVPVLVARYETERTEGIEAGVAKLVGADTCLIVSEAESYLAAAVGGGVRAPRHNPYGDGKASDRIVAILESFLNVG